MKDAIVLVVLCGLPALVVVATVDVALLGHVLSEVQALSWEHFRAD